ncbi:MAG: hypothetical protein ACR2LY_03895 [Thermoleophilaceae bacterium]
MLTLVLALLGFALLFGMILLAARHRRFELPGGDGGGGDGV